MVTIGSKHNWDRALVLALTSSRFDLFVDCLFTWPPCELGSIVC